MRVLPALLLLLASGITAASTVYKWVDEKGVTHYSDQPRPGAQKVEIEAVQTYSAPPAPATSAQPSAPAADTAATGYARIEVWKPQNDESFTNTGSVIPVNVRVEPDLQNGHAIWIYLDGKRVADLPTTGSSFQLNNVVRGTHTVTAIVTDGAGKRLIASPPVTFHVHQTSILSPARRR